MCHTPCGAIQKYDDFVLVMGPRDIQTHLAENYGLKKYVSLEEICALYPTVSQFVAHEYPNPKRLEYLKKQFFERNGEIDIEKMKISSIMIWCWVTQEGLSTQVCCDLLSSKDGTLMGPRRSKDDPQVVDMYVTSNDLFYAD